MGKEFSIVPRDVARVETKYRRIATKLPHPDSVPTLEKLRKFEPISMRGQPPVVWEKAEDIFVFDKQGLDPEGRVVGQFRATGVRPKFLDIIHTAGIHLGTDIFSHRKP